MFPRGVSVVLLFMCPVVFASVADAQVVSRRDQIDVKPPATPYVLSAPVIQGPTATICTAYWKVTIQNVKGDAGLGTAQGMFFLNGVEDGGAGGYTVNIPFPGEPGSASSGFSLLPDRTPAPTAMKVYLYRGTERVAMSPAVAVPTVPNADATFTVVASAPTTTSYSVSLHNQNALAYDATDLSLRITTGPTATGPWSTLAGGGTKFGCIAAGANTRAMNATRPADHHFLHIEGTRNVFSTEKKQQVTLTVLDRVVDPALQAKIDARRSLAPEAIKQ